MLPWSNKFKWIQRIGEVIDRNVPRGVKGHNINENTLPGSPALCLPAVGRGGGASLERKIGAASVSLFLNCQVILVSLCYIFWEPVFPVSSSSLLFHAHFTISVKNPTVQDNKDWTINGSV